MRRCFLSMAVGDLHLGAVLALNGLRTGAELRHGGTEGPKVVDHRLIDKDVAVGEVKNAFLATGLPQAPDDLKRRVGLAGAGGHDEEDAVLALGDGFDGFVDGDALVVARLLAAAVVVVVLEDDCFLRRGQALPRSIRVPELRQVTGRRPALVRFPFAPPARCGRETETRRRSMRRRKGCRASRHTRAPAACRRRRVVVVLRLDQGDGDVRLVVENVVGALGFAAGDQLAADDDPALGESRPLRESATEHPSPPS